MKISIGSRSGRGGTEPHRLCLGRCSLPVTAVLERHDEGETRVFDVRVLDGRRFVVRRRTDLEDWELVAAYGRMARQRPRACPAAPLLGPLLAALCRKALATMKRGGGARRDASAGTLPGSGAPA